MSVRLRLKYGRGEIGLNAPGPERCAVLAAPAPPGEPITPRRVRAALERPLGSPPFGELFAPGDTVTVIVPDLTRASGAPTYLPPMIGALNEAGVSDGDITILFANGIHRAQSDEEKSALVTPELFDRIRCVDHDAINAEMAPVEGPAGPVLLNRLAVACGKLVVTGAVGFHYLAGFGGGRKSIMPGVASFEDAKRFHFLSLNPDGPGRHPAAHAGNVDGNPLHEYAMRVQKSLGPVFSLNTLQDPDGTTVDIVAGDPEQAFDEGRRIVCRRSMAPVARPAEVVVASCGGHPKDINFVQAHKTYEHASLALEPGGRLFIAARCPDGPGSEAFVRWFEHGGPEKIERALRADFQINGQTALATAVKSRMFRTTLLSELDPALVRSMGVEPAASAESFIARAEKALANSDNGLVIPEGGYLLPHVVESQ